MALCPGRRLAPGGVLPRAVARPRCEPPGGAPARRECARGPGLGQSLAAYPREGAPARRVYGQGPGLGQNLAVYPPGQSTGQAWVWPRAGARAQASLRTAGGRPGQAWGRPGAGARAGASRRPAGLILNDSCTVLTPPGGSRSSGGRRQGLGFRVIFIGAEPPAVARVCVTRMPPRGALAADTGSEPLRRFGVCEWGRSLIARPAADAPDRGIRRPRLSV